MSRLSVEHRAELLAAADAAGLVALADDVLADGGELVLVAPPEVGMVMLTVREPVAHHRFHLAEVLVTRAEIELDGARGWAMRLGDDRSAALAAAVLDAEVAGGRPRTAEVLALCARTADEQAGAARAEWAELAPTSVTFDELD